MFWLFWPRISVVWAGSSTSASCPHIQPASSFFCFDDSFRGYPSFATVFPWFNWLPNHHQLELADGAMRPRCLLLSSINLSLSSPLVQHSVFSLEQPRARTTLSQPPSSQGRSLAAHPSLMFPVERESSNTEGRHLNCHQSNDPEIARANSAPPLMDSNNSHLNQNKTQLNQT